MVTILDLGNELKKLDNFDKDEYIKALEKEVARFIKNADLHVINHQKMYKELRATKRALWMARSKNADLMSCKEFYNDYKREHPRSRWNFVCMGFSYATSFTNWSRWFQYISRMCLQKAKEFK